jgi:hypothetical protein
MPRCSNQVDDEDEDGPAILSAREEGLRSPPPMVFGAGDFDGCFPAMQGCLRTREGTDRRPCTGPPSGHRAIVPFLYNLKTYDTVNLAHDS